MYRLRELDFLRGIAIILVLFRHIYLVSYFSRMGWIGVDLFFVLSGFLVSGLLFNEYIKFGNIQTKNFLIRRGFKIYPLYYIACVIYLIPVLYFENFKVIPFFSELLFFQNYINGFGYLFLSSWSLAIEEHFYFSLAFFLFLGFKYNFLSLKIELNSNKVSPFEKIIFSILILCLINRLIVNWINPDEFCKSFTMTHLRIDSLLAGVLISYLYYFRLDYLKKIFYRNQKVFLWSALLLLSFTPFLDPIDYSFIRTIGFLMLYISFGIILTFFLLTDDINNKLDKLFGKYIVAFISKVGQYSYSIYIVHGFVLWVVDRPFLNINNRYLRFFLVFSISIFIGKLITEYIEKYFLTIRDRYFPKRIQ